MNLNTANTLLIRPRPRKIGPGASVEFLGALVGETYLKASYFIMKRG